MERFTMKAFLLVLSCALQNVLSDCRYEKGTDKSEYCTKKSENNNEVRILLIGKTGVGKSTTGNTILGFPAFETKVSASSVTAKTTYSEAERFGKRLIVVDTPGYFDTTVFEHETFMEICRWHSLVSPGMNAILLVVEVGRFTEEDQKTVDFFMKIFGEELKDFLIVVFTHKDRLEEENMTVEDFVQTMDKSSNLRKLIDASKGRFTAIGYKGKTEDRIMEVKHLLSMIEKLKGKDGKIYYSNLVFQEVQKIIAVKERQMKEELEKEKKEKKYTESELNARINSVKTKIREEIAKNNNQDGFFATILKAIFNILKRILWP